MILAVFLSYSSDNYVDADALREADNREKAEPFNNFGFAKTASVATSNCAN